jgi:hypothetical protein
MGNNHHHNHNNHQQNKYNNLAGPDLNLTKSELDLMVNTWNLLVQNGHGLGNLGVGLMTRYCTYKHEQHFFFWLDSMIFFSPTKEF